MFEAQTVERWAAAYIASRTLTDKLDPPAPPARWEAEPMRQRIAAPGRPPELTVVPRAPKRPKSLKRPEARARLLHGFLHHELQAAELMCWALLAFADAEPEFRRGLLRIALDEVRHMGMYRAQIERLGSQVGEFPVRDWFWQRVPACETPLQFVATMGIGFEGGNLEHADRFALALRAAGDVEAADVQARVGREEIAHVRFATTWFARFSGSTVTFDDWVAELPPPLSPMVMRGKPLNRSQREASGLDADFLDALAQWQPT